MQTDVSNVLSDLITLSDNADQLIANTNFCNDQVGQWFSVIKETASAIVQGTYTGPSSSTGKSSCFSKDDLPSIVTLVKGKQNCHRVSALLAVQKDNRVRLSHRKSRKSLRKIVLDRKSGHQWKISDRKSSVKINDEDEITSPTSKVKDKLLESDFKTLLNSSTHKNHVNKSYLVELDSSSKRTPRVDYSTPIQSKEILAPNTDETTPVTRSKLKATVGSTIVAETNKKKFIKNNLSDVKTSIDNTTISFASKRQPSENNSIVSKESSDSQANEFVTPGSEIITIDSDGSTNKYDQTTPFTRSKRKSSAQHTQENAKRIKNATSASQVPCGKQNKSKWDDNFTVNAFKQIKLIKDINPVIPAKNLQQQIQPFPEKRILREIQKKEEKVTQNAQKLLSLKKQKIEERKKTREKKMEKAMQQRMKMERDKEERIRSRTQSKQENIQQSEPAPKKGAQKKIESAPVIKKSSKSQPEEKFEPPRKPLRSPIKKVRISPLEQKPPKNLAEINKAYLDGPSPKEIINTNNFNSTYVCSPANIETNLTLTSEKAPPKPIRSAKKQNEISNDSKGITSIKPVTSAYNSNHSSTPVAKKVESKINLTKSQVMKKNKDTNSYVITPHKNSLVSYDISEIKSDSDDDEEKVHHKPIPTWASGFNLKSALLNQQYAPVNVTELFGNYFPPLNLPRIMGVEKKHYGKRTSSAIWLESPNCSRSYHT